MYSVIHPYEGKSRPFGDMQWHIQCAGIQQKLEVVKNKWKELNKTVSEIRSLMEESLQGWNHTVAPGEEMEQLQRLLLLGESACAPEAVSHFLINKLGTIIITPATPGTLLWRSIPYPFLLKRIGLLPWSECRIGNEC